MTARAETRVSKELLEDFKRISGKNNLLFQIAEATLDKPDGVVREVVFPVVSEQTLRNLVKEYKSTGSAYREKVYTVMRTSYSHHYRLNYEIFVLQALRDGLRCKEIWVVGANRYRNRHCCGVMLIPTELFDWI